MQDPIPNIHYGDWDDVKAICAQHPAAGRLGGKGVCERHFGHLTYNQLRLTLCPSGNDREDEFLEIYNKIISKIIA